MSDLRDRIAKALFNVEPVDDFHGGIIAYLETDEPDVMDTGRRIDGTINFALLADAVIAELGLYREGRESRTVTNEQGATYRIEGGHRYVTDWKADDA